MLQQISQIVEGTFNNITNRKEDLFKERIAICNTCKLKIVDEIFGIMCNKRMWLNPITDETALIPLDGYVKGCGCVMESKTRVPEATCVAGKW